MKKMLVAFGASLGMLMGACSIYESEDSSGMDPSVNGPAVEDSASSTESSSAMVNPGSSASKTSDSGSSSSKKSSGDGNLIVTDECGGEFTDPRDGQSYKTVKIGSRCWFAENLNYADETAVPNMKNNHFCPSGKTENCEKFGRLYNWSTAIDSAAVFKKQEVICSNTNQCFAEEPIQGLCPDGWRMSSMDDWFNLMSELKNNFYSLQQTGYTEWGSATNSSGFSAVPVGFMQAGAYDNVGTQAGFWTTSQSTTYAQWAGFVVISSDEIVPGEGDKSNYAFAVRCLK